MCSHIPVFGSVSNVPIDKLKALQIKGIRGIASTFETLPPKDRAATSDFADSNQTADTKDDLFLQIDSDA